MRSSVGSSRRIAVVVIAVAASVGLLASVVGSATPVSRLYLCVNPAVPTQRASATATTTCKPGWRLVWWSVTDVTPTTPTTQPPTTTPTTVVTTTATTQPPTTTATTTTTTTPSGTPAFLSRPAASCGMNLSGASVSLSNRTFQGCSGVALTVSNATNVTLSGLDFANNVGDVFLINVTGNVSVSGIRARNTGDGTIGSGHSNVIQFNDVWDTDPAVDVWNVKAYGGDTEDVISVFQSGGTSSTNLLLLEDIHVEHPLSGALAWQSDSSTCINLADAGGSNTVVRDSSFLNCGAVGLQMNEPGGAVRYVRNVVYGATRPDSNVGASQWSAADCSVCVATNEFRDNRINWKNSSGSNNGFWLSGNYPVADVGNVKQDATINPDNLRVVL